MSLDNVEYITISKIGRPQYLYHCLAEVSTDVFLILQKESVFIAAKGLTSDKFMKRNNLLIKHKHDKGISVIES
jgi:hypothetical protein